MQAIVLEHPCESGFQTTCSPSQSWLFHDEGRTGEHVEIEFVACRCLYNWVRRKCDFCDCEFPSQAGSRCDFRHLLNKETLRFKGTHFHRWRLWFDSAIPSENDLSCFFYGISLQFGPCDGKSLRFDDACGSPRKSSYSAYFQTLLPLPSLPSSSRVMWHIFRCVALSLRLCCVWLFGGSHTCTHVVGCCPVRRLFLRVAFVSFFWFFSPPLRLSSSSLPLPSFPLSLSLPQPEQSQELPVNNLRRTTQLEFGWIPVRCPGLYAVGCCLETLVNLVFGVAPSWVLLRVGLLPFSSRGLGLYAVYGVGWCLDLVGGVVPCHGEVWAICRRLLSDFFCVPRFPKQGAELRLWPCVRSCPECVRKVLLRF